MAQGDGIRACEDAFERLLAGKPNNKEFVGLPKDKITASVVSKEAEFDPGYLKSSRKTHKPLIARIVRNKEDSTKNEDGGVREKLRRAINKSEVSRKSESAMKVTLDKVLTQNLMLVERVRELEEELRTQKNVIGHPKRNE